MAPVAAAGVTHFSDYEVVDDELNSITISITSLSLDTYGSGTGF